MSNAQRHFEVLLCGLALSAIACMLAYTLLALEGPSMAEIFVWLCLAATGAALCVQVIWYGKTGFHGVPRPRFLFMGAIAWVMILLIGLTNPDRAARLAHERLTTNGVSIATLWHILGFNCREEAEAAFAALGPH